MDNQNYGWYSKGSLPLSEMFSERITSVEAIFDKNLGDHFEALTKIMDNTYRLASYHIWLFNMPHLVELPKNRSVIFSAIHKNFFVLHSALSLTRSGLFGPARTLLRHVFEYLVVAKFCAISEDDRVFESWDSGDTVYFTNGVLKKIIKPDNGELKDFWHLMCQYSHSTNSSQQVSIEWDGSEDDVYVTLCFIRAMLECQYHLLNSVLITKSMRSFAKKYDDDNAIKEVREKNRKILKLTRAMMGKKARDLTRCYVASWQISS